jgi:hypothetical protein
MGKRVVHVAATLRALMPFQREVERRFLLKDRRSFLSRCRERASARDDGSRFGWCPSLRIGRDIRLWGKR